MSTLLSSSSSSFLSHSSHRPLSRSLILYNTIPLISSRFNAAAKLYCQTSFFFFIYIFSNVGWFHLCLFDIHRELNFQIFRLYTHAVHIWKIFIFIFGEDGKYFSQFSQNFFIHPAERTVYLIHWNLLNFDHFQKCAPV